MTIINDDNLLNQFNIFLTQQTIKMMDNIPFEQIINNWSGYGIVMPAGGIRYLSNAYLNIRYIRNILKSDIPIEIWYLGPNEKIEHLFDAIYNLGNVIFIDAYEHKKKYPFNNLNGWELKSYAIIHSKFKEIIYLDSDCFLFISPDILFNHSIYREHNAVFSCDIDVHHHWSGRLVEPETFIVPKLGIFSNGKWDYSQPNPLWQMLDIEEDNLPEFETGFIMVNKAKYAEPLFTTLFLNENSHIIYKYIYGDKDTFHLAWAKHKSKCNMIRSVNRNDTFIEGRLENQILFQHRVLHAKFNIEIPWMHYPNNCAFYDQAIFRQYFNDIVEIQGNHQFNKIYMDINNIDTAMPGSCEIEARPFIDFVNKIINKYKTINILDVGCGNANLTRFYNLQNSFYHGIDVSELAIQQAMSKLPNLKFTNIDALYYKNYNEHDLIIIKDVFNHLSFQDINTIIMKCTKSNQYILIVTDIPHDNKDINRASYRKIDPKHLFKLNIQDEMIYNSGHVTKQCLLIH